MVGTTLHTSTRENSEAQIPLFVTKRSSLSKSYSSKWNILTMGRHALLRLATNTTSPTAICWYAQYRQDSQHYRRDTAGSDGYFEDAPTYACANDNHDTYDDIDGNRSQTHSDLQCSDGPRLRLSTTLPFYGCRLAPPPLR